MTASTAELSAGLRRISRRDLAQNQMVWRATAAMYGVFCAATIGMLAVGGGEHQTQRLVFLAGMLAVAIAVLRGRPPATGSWGNHAVLACTYVAMMAALFAFQPHPEVAIAISIFVGPLVATRLDARRAFVAHLSAATVLLGVGGVVGGLTGALTEATLVAMLLLAFSIWCLGFSCMVALEAAEAQGDDLERLVRRDPLTGVGNRRMLLERLDAELERHIRQDLPLAVVALDLSGFKAFDDTVGHAAGDELLRQVAAALEGVVRPGDAVVRQGGDEFCLILAETPAQEVSHVVDAVRAALAAILIDGQALRGGLGVATYPEDAATRAQLLEIADRRLVQAKRGDGTA